MPWWIWLLGLYLLGFVVVLVFHLHFLQMVTPGLALLRAALWPIYLITGWPRGEPLTIGLVLMKTYTGHRNASGFCIVRTVTAADGAHPTHRSLRLRLDLANHSPTGFEWGYGGSGPAQLALALLADALGDGKTAVALHQNFKFAIVGRLPRDAPWQLTLDDVLKGAVAAAEPHSLIREPDGRIYRLCGECASFLLATGLVVADAAGVLSPAPRYDIATIKQAAKGNHGADITILEHGGRLQ